MDKDTIIKKIKKCFALSKSANAHEAAAALRQAQKLMELHAIETSDIALTDIFEESVKARGVALSAWEGMLARLIADTFGCAHLTRTGHKLTSRFTYVKYRTFIFIGAGATPQVAKYVYDVLARQCAAARSRHIGEQPRHCKSSTKTARGGVFAIGWVCGARQLVERFAGAVRDETLLDQYMLVHYPNLNEAKYKCHRAQVDASHARSGRIAGASAQLDRGVAGANPRGLLSRLEQNGEAQ